MYQQKLYNLPDNIKNQETINKIILDINNRKIGFINNILDPDIENEIFDKVDEIAQFASTLIIFGTGGSILGGKAILSSLNKTKKIHLIDYIDPSIFDFFLKTVNLDESAFIAISKSGETLETVTQVIRTIKYFNERLDVLKNRFYFLTENPNSKMGMIAKKLNDKIIRHDPSIGGRFSCFSNVALIPSLFLKCNIRDIRDGAKTALNNFINQTDTIVTDSVNMAISCIESKKNTFAYMPYIYSFSAYNDWLCQLVSETTGKNGFGITPLKCMGSIDQHSILQLFIDGPRDKYFTIINTNNNIEEEKLNSDYLNGLNFTMGEILDNQCKIILQSLIKLKLPVREIELDNLSEKTIGGLMMNMMLEIITITMHYNLDPFAQNAVDVVKSKINEKLLFNS
ncbi:MAG: hypothetical protein HRT87_10000 [Legionellales bacterium]|nr:hypothetical protein [Legionellales bacterium]